MLLKLYWTTKLPDGNIWMTQNLDLGGASDIRLKSDATDLVEGHEFTLKASEVETFQDYNISRMFDPGDKYIPNGTDGANVDNLPNINCTLYSNGGVNCHYHLGNYYNWYAMTAGSDITTMDSNDKAPESICPKGWQLPGGSWGSAGDHKSFQYLVEKTGLNASNVTRSPYYFTRSGNYSWWTIRNLGTIGAYLSSAVGNLYGDVYNAQSMTFDSAEVYLLHTYARDGHPVRCVAK